MNNAQAADKPWHQKCSRCEKPTFVDLLDSSGLCDYCREIQSFKTVTKQKNKKQKERR
jgi:hypothetical protein